MSKELVEMGTKEKVRSTIVRNQNALQGIVKKPYRSFDHIVLTLGPPLQ